jgi:hypothetical protein
VLGSEFLKGGGFDSEGLEETEEAWSWRGRCVRVDEVGENVVREGGASTTVSGKI